MTYLGNFNRHARQTLELNPIPQGAYANPANLFNNTEINPNFLRTNYPGMGSLGYVSYSLSNLNYYALQIQAQHRLAQGLQFSASYSFSKALGTQGVGAHTTRKNSGFTAHSTRTAGTF